MLTTAANGPLRARFCRIEPKSADMSRIVLRIGLLSNAKKPTVKQNVDG